MEKVYSTEQNACDTWEVSKETINFLLAFSKSLRYTRYKQLQFETNLN